MEEEEDEEDLAESPKKKVRPLSLTSLLALHFAHPFAHHLTAPPVQDVDLEIGLQVEEAPPAVQGILLPRLRRTSKVFHLQLQPARQVHAYHGEFERSHAL